MNSLRDRLASVLLAGLIGVASPAVALAAPSGLAWDSVTKLAMGEDPSSLQPGSFDDDYATASAVQAPDQGGGGGGLFAHIQAAMSMGQTMQLLMQNGLAEKHYIAGSKERTDRLAMQSATIADCVARTITTLNLKNKTYRVTSMDQPSEPAIGGGGNASGGSFKDDGTKISIAVTSSALGSRQVGGRQAAGFSSDMTMTETKPSGESQTQKGNLVGYYASIGMPSPSCPRAASLTGESLGAGQGFAMVAQAMKVMRAMASAGFDKRFSITQSGPTLPIAQLSMYQALTFSGQRGRGVTIVIERGDVRSIDANDPVFSVPAGFTREQ